MALNYHKGMATDYGKRLKAARKSAKLTQAGLKDKTGIAQSTISSAEIGGSGSSETPVLAAALGVNALWLATGEGPQHANESQAVSPPAVLPSPEVKISQPGIELSEDALELALWFDRLTDDPYRTVAQVIATNAITQQLALRDAARLAEIVGQPAAPTTPAPIPTAPLKKSPAPRQSAPALPRKR